jgi:hypothetical protein
MLPTDHRTKLEVPLTRSIPPSRCPADEPASAARQRSRLVAAVAIAAAIAAASAGCPAPAPTEPPPKTPPPLSQPETDRCAGDAGTAADCTPEGCTEALAPDAAADQDPEPNCDALLAD